MSRIALITVFVAISFGSVYGQSPSATMERILIPLHTEEPIQGADGSLWATELALVVRGEEPILISGYYFEPCNILCPAPLVPPSLTFYPSFGENRLSGIFLAVEKAHSNDLVAQLRARDISRQADDWGAEIPTVRQSEAPVGRFDILDLPSNSDYRWMLRIYHFEEGTVPVTVRFYRVDPELKNADNSVATDELIGEVQVMVVGGDDSFTPGYAQVAGHVAPVPHDAGRFRIQVASETDARLWGFVTLTNNQTQHVTVVSPN